MKAVRYPESTFSAQNTSGKRTSFPQEEKTGCTQIKTQAGLIIFPSGRPDSLVPFQIHGSFTVLDASPQSSESWLHKPAFTAHQSFARKHATWLLCVSVLLCVNKASSGWPQSVVGSQWVTEVRWLKSTEFSVSGYHHYYLSHISASTLRLE